MKRLRKWIAAMLVTAALGSSLAAEAAVERQRFIPTIEQSVIYTFGGFSRRSSLEDILKRMDENNMRGTFFVSERELQRNKDNIDMIVAHGQELGIGLRINVDPNKKDDFKSVCEQIQRIQSMIKEYYGVETNLVRDLYGYNEQFLYDAVEATGCQLIGQTVNVVNSKDKEAKDADEVMSHLFGKGVTSLGRGQIVYIRTDYYNNETLAGDMMMAVKKAKIDNISYRTFDDTPENNPSNDSSYSIVSIGDILNKKESRYTYPVSLTDVPQELQPGYVAEPVTKENFSKEFRRRYIGSPTVDSTNRTIGFSFGDLTKMDHTGVVKNVELNTVFFTFDDWGNDDSVNKLLYVLRKHNVKGTFYIITWNMLNNPNLLRAIAAAGHEIGSHTNGHKAMAIYDESADRYVPVMGKEEYADDVAAAYEKLVSVVGDVKVNGKYSLTRQFRPPTLAINKKGVQSIFDAGYSYMVSGYESTSDYEAPMLQSMVGALQKGIYDENNNVRSGSIIVMHMTNAAKFTARALDIMLTVNEKRSDDDPMKFKVGMLGDYLVKGYDQMAKDDMPKATVPVSRTDSKN